MIKILIADDHSLIRDGFKKYISKEADMKVVGEAENAYDVIEFFRKNTCDILVLDINMPGKSGLDLLKELNETTGKLKVLILSVNPEERFAIRALKNGASGYITKESAPEELIKAIRKVNDGGKYISVSMAEKLAFDISGNSKKSLHDKLSDREFQILQLIGMGKSINMISEELSLSQSTINTYRQRILEKMNMKSNAEMIHYAIKNNIVD